MVRVNKRPVVIQDLIEQATYIAENNLEAAERFLTAAETTFQLLGNKPAIGKLSQLSNPLLVGIRQYPVKRFKNHLVFYRILNGEVEVLRVLHGARDLAAILDEETSG
jgi:toxin ParE1/3/4